MYKYKGKITAIIVLLLCVISIYLYLFRLEDNFNSAQRSSERCLSELNSLKYQLNVVTEYKNRIDKLLTETQKSYDSEKDRSKYIMEGFMAMKQQTSICQSQFEDLQNECKKVKEDYNKVVKELEKLKTPS